MQIKKGKFVFSFFSSCFRYIFGAQFHSNFAHPIGLCLQPLAMEIHCYHLMTIQLNSPRVLLNYLQRRLHHFSLNHLPSSIILAGSAIKLFAKLDMQIAFRFYRGLSLVCWSFHLQLDKHINCDCQESDSNHFQPQQFAKSKEVEKKEFLSDRTNKRSQFN